jgi:hypothetical protein
MYYRRSSLLLGSGKAPVLHFSAGELANSSGEIFPTEKMRAHGDGLEEK